MLGEFQGDDKLIVRTAKNVYYTTNFDITQHFPDDTVHVSKYSPDTVYAVAYFDRSQNYYYLKRFTAEQGEKMQSFLDEDADLVAVTSCPGAVLVLTFQGAQASRPAEEIDVDGFVGVKSHRAKGKRLTTYDVDRLRMIEPELPPEPEPSDDEGLEGGQLTGASADAAQGAVTETENSGKSAPKKPSAAQPAPEKAPAGQPRTGTAAGGGGVRGGASEGRCRRDDRPRAAEPVLTNCLR